MSACGGTSERSPERRRGARPVALGTALDCGQPEVAEGEDQREERRHEGAGHDAADEAAQGIGQR